MTYSNFHNIVKLLMKKRNKILSGDQIGAIAKIILEDHYTTSKLYKIIYQLKNRGYLVSVKKDYYYIKQADDLYDNEKVLAQYYWYFVYQHCQNYIKGFWYIGGLKAIQIMMHNLEIPHDLLIVTDYKQSHECVILDRYISTKSYNTKHISLLKKFKPFTVSCSIQGKKMRRAGLELGLLEILYNCDLQRDHYIVELVKNILQKYYKKLDYNKLADIVKIGKHHTSINRLYTLSKYIDDSCASPILTIIKKYSYIISVA